MLLIGLAAAVFSILTPQTDLEIEALLAPAMTPNDVAAFCFAPTNRRPGERDRDCQYRVLREDPARVARIDGLRRRCERQASSPGGTVDQCVVRTLVAERDAAEAARVERAAAAERTRVDGARDFDALFAEARPSPPSPPPPPPPEPEPPRRNCRRETTTYPDGTGGSVRWICGNDEALGDQLRDLLRAR